MANDERPRVLIVDNDPRVCDDWRAILQDLGYVVQVSLAEGATWLSRTVEMAREFRPHVAVVDLRLVDEYGDDVSGLELLPNLRSAQCILYSSYLTARVAVDAVRRYGVADCVGKQDSPKRLLDAIAEAIVKNCAACSSMTLEQPEDWTPEQTAATLFGAGSDVPTRIASDVLTQLFPACRVLRLTLAGGETSTSLRLSRGHSIVYKVQPDDREPVVVKLMPVDKIRREQANYDAHIRDRLVGRFYAQLERMVGFWDLGGAVYSFMGSSRDDLPSFATFYRQQDDPQVILEPLDYFFRHVWGRHYGHLSDEHVPLFQVYSQTLRLEERLNRLNTQDETQTFPGLPAPVLNPVVWVLRHSRDRIPLVRQVVTHGDLHGDNLFVDGRYAWAIDFERTGLGHILRDFVELEVDIITRLVSWPADDFTAYYEFVLALVDQPRPPQVLQAADRWPPGHETRKALTVIAGLRKMAIEVTGCSDSRECLWGLLLDALFLATLSSGDPQRRDRALLLSAVLCERLSQ